MTPEYPWARVEPGMRHPIVIQVQRSSELALTLEQARRLMRVLQMAIENAEKASELDRYLGPRKEGV